MDTVAELRDKIYANKENQKNLLKYQSKMSKEISGSSTQSKRGNLKRKKHPSYQLLDKITAKLHKGKKTVSK